MDEFSSTFNSGDCVPCIVRLAGSAIDISGPVAFRAVQLSFFALAAMPFSIPLNTNSCKGKTEYQ